MGNSIYFGGLDLAKRVDLSAFVLLEYKNGKLNQKGQKTWDGINYKTVVTDILKIQRKYRMTKLCVDRSGVGDAVIEMFTKEIPFEEVITSLPTKLEIINMLHNLFQNNKITIRDKELYDQVLEQEQHISEAGNILYRHPTNKHDDLFWALGYACYASRGYFGGRPKPSMVRKDRKIKGLSDVEEDIERTVGRGWNIIYSG